MIRNLRFCYFSNLLKLAEMFHSGLFNKRKKFWSEIKCFKLTQIEKFNNQSDFRFLRIIIIHYNLHYNFAKNYDWEKQKHQFFRVVNFVRTHK